MKISEWLQWENGVKITDPSQKLQQTYVKHAEKASDHVIVITEELFGFLKAHSTISEILEIAKSTFG